MTVDYLDDGHSGTTRTFDFQTALPFEPLHKVTYTFPMKRIVLSLETFHKVDIILLLKTVVAMKLPKNST